MTIEKKSGKKTRKKKGDEGKNEKNIKNKNKGRKDDGKMKRRYVEPLNHF